VAGLATVALLRLELEDDELRTTVVLGNRRDDLCASNDRSTDGDALVARDHKHAVDLDLLACLGLEPFNFDRVACGDAVLLTACLNDRVHRDPLLPLFGTFNSSAMMLHMKAGQRIR
jgi:hypothetical protein